jgi:predicted cytidylate kinase
MLLRNSLPALKVYLDARIEVRALRVGVREHETEVEAMENIAARERSEATRYMQYYGIDLYDRSVYDIVIDTSDIAPEEVVEVIIAKLGELTC